MGHTLGTIGNRIDDVEIDDAELVELLGNIRESFDRIGVRHRVEGAIGRDAIAHAIGA